MRLLLPGNQADLQVSDGIRLYDPSKRVYIPALACSSSMLSSLLSVQIRAKAASR
jgi:hypothetical protein